MNGKIYLLKMGKQKELKKPFQFNEDDWFALKEELHDNSWFVFYQDLEKKLEKPRNFAIKVMCNIKVALAYDLPGFIFALEPKQAYEEAKIAVEKYVPELDLSDVKGLKGLYAGLSGIKENKRAQSLAGLVDMYINSH